MSYSLTMQANPAAGSFGDFLSARHGRKWVLAQRMTDNLRRAGHESNITRKQYAAAEREWEILAYGAPLSSLETAAPAMLAALRTIDAEFSAAADPTRKPSVAVLNRIWQAAQTAIAAAEGRA